MTETLPPVRTTHTFHAPGGPWCYDMWGRHGRPVVLIPPVLVDRASWWPVAADLRPHATVIAVDLPGHGTSGARQHYEPGELVDDLAGLIDSLHLRRAPVIVGHGPSAVLATLFAARYATHAVIAVDPTPPAGLTAGVNAYLRALELDVIPEQYRSMIDVSRDRNLLGAYAAGLRRLRPAIATIGVNPVRLAVYSRPADECEPDTQAAPYWRHEVYEIPGRFVHVSAVRRFVADLRTLL